MVLHHLAIDLSCKKHAYGRIQNGNTDLKKQFDIFNCYKLIQRTLKLNDTELLGL